MSDFFDDLIRFGLIFGAIFQLICISAVILIPNDKMDSISMSNDFEAEEEFNENQILIRNQKKSQNMRNKDKKKRR